MIISLETLKLYEMYLERKKHDHKTDTLKSWSENLSERVMIDLTLDRVKYMIQTTQESYEVVS
jgi:hypothetical protein